MNFTKILTCVILVFILSISTSSAMSAYQYNWSAIPQYDNLIQGFPMMEENGTVADDVSLYNNDGTYASSNITYGVQSPSNDTNAIGLSGYNTYIDMCLNNNFGEDWDGNSYSFITWGKVDSLERWTDNATYRYPYHIRDGVHSDYYTVAGKSSDPNELVWRRRVGGLVHEQNYTYTSPPTDWFCQGMTYNGTTGATNFYLWDSQNGFQKLDPITDTTTWPDENFPTSGTSVLGAGSTTMQEWFGAISSTFTWNTPLTDTEMQEMVNLTLDGFEDIKYQTLVDGFHGYYTETHTGQRADTVTSLDYTHNSSNVQSISLNLTSDTVVDPYTEMSSVPKTIWYRFDEGSGTNVINWAGGGLNGTRNYGNNWTVGKHNGAAYSHGGNANINSFNTTILGNDNFTISMWTKTTADNKYLFSAGSVPRFYIQTLSTGGLKTGYNEVSPTFATATISQNQWTHVLWEVDTHNNIIYIYVNNILKGTSTYANDGLPSTMCKISGPSSTKIQTVDDFVLLKYLANESVRNILYYDGVQQIRARTNSNSTYSEYWNSSSDNPLLLSTNAGDSVINSIQYDVPTNITQNGINIYYYNQTAGPATADISVSYSDNVSLLNKIWNSAYFTVGLVHTPYTRVASGLIQCPLDGDYIYNSVPVITSTNPNATSENMGTYLEINTGYVPMGVSHTYIITTRHIDGLYTGFASRWNTTSGGWDFVGNSPTRSDVSQFIGDEIEVTVSGGDGVSDINWSYHNPNNTSCYGRFEISNASIGQNWSIKLDNVTSGYTYKLFSNDNIMYATAIAGDNVSLNVTGMQDGSYWIGYINDSNSFVTPSIVVGVSFVIGSAIIATFVNRFRRRE